MHVAPEDIEAHVQALSDEDLKKELVKMGVKPGPIVSTTRKVYEKKLERHFEEFPPLSEPNAIHVEGSPTRSPKRSSPKRSSPRRSSPRKKPTPQSSPQKKRRQPEPEPEEEEEEESDSGAEESITYHDQDERTPLRRRQVEQDSTNGLASGGISAYSSRYAAPLGRSGNRGYGTVSRPSAEYSADEDDEPKAQFRKNKCQTPAKGSGFRGTIIKLVLFGLLCIFFYMLFTKIATLPSNENQEPVKKTAA